MSWDSVSSLLEILIRVTFIDCREFLLHLVSIPPPKHPTILVLSLYSLPQSHLPQTWSLCSHPQTPCTSIKSILFSLPRYSYASQPDPFSLLNHSVSMDCSLIIIYSMATIHLEENIYCIFLSGSELLHSGWLFFFLLTSIFLQISWYHYF